MRVDKRDSQGALLVSVMETSLARELMSNEEWDFYERFILAIRAPNGRKPTDHRLVLDGIFWIARTGSQWRDLPAEFGKWSSVYRQFRRWTWRVCGSRSWRP